MKRFLTGDNRDVKTKLNGPVLNLEGGGGFADGAMQRTIDEVRGCTDCDEKIDVVVLGLSFTHDITGKYDQREADYLKSIHEMKGVDSVEVILITGRDDADKDEVAKTSSAAEVVFFGGGGQCDFVKYVRGTKVARAIDAVYRKGGAVGGSSAGQAIQGEFVYDGCAGSAMAQAALADPYDKTVTFTYDFIRWRYLEDTVTDQHLVKRSHRTDFCFYCPSNSRGKGESGLLNRC